MFTTVLLVIVMLALGFVAGAFIGPRYGIGYQPPTETPLQNVVVGTNTPFPPFEYRNTTTQALIGLDIDLINEIGARSHWNVVWRDFQDWDTLLAAIQFRGVDIGASSITSSGATGASRNATMTFSNYYYIADQAVLIKSGTTAVACPGTECTPNDLANHTVAVQTLTSSFNWVNDNLVSTNKTPASMVHDFGDLNSVIQELVNGNVEFVLVDKPIAQNFANANPSLVIAGPIITNEQYSYATAKDDPGGFIAKINAALADMKADGTFKRIMDKWLS